MTISMDENKSGLVGEFLGFNIYESKHCVEWIRVRRHRKWRIDKKWRKRFGYKEVPIEGFLMNKEMRMIIGHPTMVEKLIEAIKEHND